MERYDPNCRPALDLLAHLRTPGYYNKTIGPKFIAKVEEVVERYAPPDARVGAASLYTSP